MVWIAIEYELVNLEAASINSVLDRTHFLSGLWDTLNVEICSETTQHFEHWKRARSDTEKDCADSFVIALLINIYVLLP